MDPNDVGGALTGGTVDPAQAAGQWDDFLNRPGNRQALLQIGLNMMQPLAMGQTVGGHIGQAVGAGGEAVDRAEAQDLKERKADDTLAVANERLRIAQQNADSSATRAGASASLSAARAAALGSKKVGGLTDLMKARFARQDAASFDRQLERDAKDIVKQANDVLADPNSDVAKKYKGKTAAEVREMLRAERPKPQYGAVPSNEDDNTEDPTDPASAPAEETPPYPGARKAADGNWYVPDKNKPGKYLLVR
jgi:hypothetical protein